MVVWITDWEMQCCGDPFAVGSEVEWGLAPAEQASGTREFLTGPLGEPRVTAITHYETHHPDDTDPDAEQGPPPVPTRGRVISITAAYWRLQVEETWRIGMPRILYPAPGTAVLEPRQKADGWEPERAELDFGGYIVELAPLE